MKGKKVIPIIFLLGIGIFLIYFFTIWRPFAFRTRVHTATVNGAQLVYYTRGSGKPLIFMTGFGMTMQDWDPLLLEKLSKNHQLILFDDRGVGDSTGDISQMTEAQRADDIIQLMNALHMQKADIFGWSMGSFIAQIAAEQYPSRIDKLILVSTAPDIPHMAIAKNQTNSNDQTDLFGNWETAFVPLMFADTRNKQAYIDRLHKAIQTGEVPQDQPESAAVRAKQEQAMADQNQENLRYENLPNIQAATLVVSGQKDTILPPENGKIVAQRIPHSQLVITPNAGHAVMFEKVDEFVTVVEEFLK